MSPPYIRVNKSAAYEASRTFQLGIPLTLYYVTASSKAAAAGWIFIFDLAALPANGVLPQFPPLPIMITPCTISFNWMPDGRPMINGVSVAFSSTQATLTLGTADIWFEIGFYAGQ